MDRSICTLLKPRVCFCDFERWTNSLRQGHLWRKGRISLAAYRFWQVIVLWSIALHVWWQARKTWQSSYHRIPPHICMVDQVQSLRCRSVKAAVRSQSKSKVDKLLATDDDIHQSAYRIVLPKPSTPASGCSNKPWCLFSSCSGSCWWGTLCV